MDTAIQHIAEEAIKSKVFPGAVIGYIKNNQKHVLPFGHLTYEKSAPVTHATIYDVASLTKVIPTCSIILRLIEQGLLSENDHITQFIPEMQNPGREQILIWHLLTFTVAFDLKDRLSNLAPLGMKAVLQKIYSAPLLHPPGETYFYSNVPSLLLGMVAEIILNKPLDTIAEELLFKPLQMHSTSFHPGQLNQSLIAPTEVIEKGETRGRVQDETAFAFYTEGVITGHAGIFSTADDLLNFAQMLIRGGELNGQSFFKPASIHKMRTELIHNGKAGMSLGWEMNRVDYMIPVLSPKVFGKNGFTGTLMLIDLEAQIALVMLSNRTYPTRPKNTEKLNAVRKAIEEIVFT